MTLRVWPAPIVLACLSAVAACGGLSSSQSPPSASGSFEGPGEASGSMSSWATDATTAETSPPSDAGLDVRDAGDDTLDASLDADATTDAVVDLDAGVDAYMDADTGGYIATTQILIEANIDANATTPALPWDPQNPAATSNFSTAITVFDSLGNRHNVDVYFRNEGPGFWTYHVLTHIRVPDAGRPPNLEIGSGTLGFASDGSLASATREGGTVAFRGAAAQTIVIDLFGPPAGSDAWATGNACGNEEATFGLGNLEAGADAAGCLGWITQVGGPSYVLAQSQNGIGKLPPPMDAGPPVEASPSPTTEIRIVANLDANATFLAPSNPSDPLAISNFTITTSVYDALGNSHAIAIGFHFVSTSLWYVYLLVMDVPMSDGSSQNVLLGSGSLVFYETGALDNASLTDGTIAFPGSPPQTITLHMGWPILQGGTGLNGVTQFAAPSNVTSVTMNGAPPPEQ